MPADTPSVAPASPSPAGDPHASGWDCHTHVFSAAQPVRAGHYQPPERTLAELAREAAPQGIGHIVLVQPSVYGADNSLLLEGLRAGAGRHRAVAVVDASITEHELDALAEAGVRGVRFNLVSPVGNDLAALPALAPRLRARGMHVQWYAAPAQLDRIRELHARYRLPCVLDHLAGFRADAARDPAAWHALEALAGMDAWIKLSAWYRQDAGPSWTALDPLVRELHGLFGPHCVWGSDWPHTLYLGKDAPGAPPAYADTIAPLARALGPDEAGRILRRNPAVLYR